MEAFRTYGNEGLGRDDIELPFRFTSYLSVHSKQSKNKRGWLVW